MSFDPCACCGAEMDEHWKYCETCVEANCDLHTARCGDEPEDRTDDPVPPVGQVSLAEVVWPEDDARSENGGK